MNNSVNRILLGACFVFYVALCVAYRPFVADDAFIVGRYALNAAAGNGLVYNIGEQVSALTSPLHAIVETVLAFFTDDPVALYRMLAPGVPIIGVLFAFRIYRPSAEEAAVVAVFALASPFVALWAVGGLETPLLCGLLTVFTAYFFKAVRTNKVEDPDLLAIGVLAALAFLTRYDSLLITAPLMAAMALCTWRRPMLWIAGAVSALIAGSWLVFAQMYYGDVLPTSAYLKLLGGGNSLADSVTLFNALIVTGALLGGVLLIAQPDKQPSSGFARVLGAGAIMSASLFVLYASKTSSAHMMFGYRMFVPILFPTAMVLGAYLVRGRMAFVLFQAATHGVVSVLVLAVGMNVQPIWDFGKFGAFPPENHKATPRAYGNFIATLRQDAQDLSAHWRAQGIDRQPKIFLYTGGTGYWMRDFYVYETLVSYRKSCPPNVHAILASSDYVQDMSVAANPRIQAIYAKTFTGLPKFDVVAANELFMYKTWSIAYNFAPPRQSYDLTKRTTDLCTQ